MMLVCDANGYPIERNPMKVAEYQDEVDGLTLGQCVDHPRWLKSWLPSIDVGGGYGVWVDDAPNGRARGDFLERYDYPTPLSAARAALRMLLPPRPPEVVVTEEDRLLALEIWNAMGDGAFGREEFCDLLQPLIAAYRTKHAGKP